MKLFVFFFGFLAFLVTLLIIPYFIRFLTKIGLIVKDQNKESKSLIPISGGMPVLIGIVIGMMGFIFLRTFFPESSIGLVLDNRNLNLLFASLISILLITIIGFFDDLLVNKTNDNAIGLNRWQKPLLTIIAAVPLMVVKAGQSTMLLPFFGRIDLGWIYALVFVPIGVIGASNMVNMLAGYNGLESGLGLIYFGSLGLFAYVNKSYMGALIALIIFCALLAFYFYNKFPAKIFPGNSLTYLLGGGLACVAIIGDIEKAALIISIPFILEFVLKLRGGFKKQSYGEFKDGKLRSLYDKIYSIPHFFTRTGRFSERKLVYCIYLIEIIFAALIWVI